MNQVFVKMNQQGETAQEALNKNVKMMLELTSTVQARIPHHAKALRKQMDKRCRVCGKYDKKTSKKCSCCETAYYCCREHQKQHWKNGHREKCGNIKQKPPQDVKNFQLDVNIHKLIKMKNNEASVMLAPNCIWECFGEGKNSEGKPVYLLRTMDRKDFWNIIRDMKVENTQVRDYCERLKTGGIWVYKKFIM